MKKEQDFRFAASVASFGMLLRDSEHKGADVALAALRCGNERTR